VRTDAADRRGVLDLPDQHQQPRLGVRADAAGRSELFLILGILLYLGTTPANWPWALLCDGCREWRAAWARQWQSHAFKVGTLVVVAVLGLIGYETWYQMLRVVPEQEYASDEDHYKYAAIGLGIEARIPYYLFAVLPQMCPEKLPKPGGWEVFGFSMRTARTCRSAWPSGRSATRPWNRTARCVTQDPHNASDVAVNVPSAPANTLQLQAFQWFAYDCASDPTFTTDAVMAAINGKFQLGFFEKLYNRYLIIPMAKALCSSKAGLRLAEAAAATGPGRTDTFNPTKMVVFGFPDDSTIGTVDLPQVWNQKPRESMYLHWDGNNNKIHERNYAAAMAVGATPESVLPPSFNRVTNWLLGHKAPAWPWALDQAKVAQGKPIWDANCAACHDFGRADTGQGPPTSISSAPIHIGWTRSPPVW
jgi:hypothetical protein